MFMLICYIVVLDVILCVWYVFEINKFTVYVMKLTIKGT